MEQLKDRALEHMKQKREEYDKLMGLLKERVEEMNAHRGKLPQFVIGKSSIQLDRFILHLEFDQLFTSPTDYVLVLRVGQRTKPMFGSESAAVRHIMQPKVSDDFASIVWELKSGNLAPFTTAEVVEFALDMLSGYYSRYTPN